MKSLFKAPMKLDLQFFAEGGDGDSGNTGNQSGEDTQTGGTDSTDDDNQKSDEDSDKKYSRSEVRKMFASQMNDFKSKELPDLLKQAEEKGAQRAQMSDKEKADADKKQREDELNKREQALNQREALADTTTLLSNEGLPTSFATMLSDLNADKRTENVNSFKKAFSESVHNAVLDQTKGGKTPNTGNSGTHEENSGIEFAKQANNQSNGMLKNDPWKLKQ